MIYSASTYAPTYASAPSSMYDYMSAGSTRGGYGYGSYGPQATNMYGITPTNPLVSSYARPYFSQNLRNSTRDEGKDHEFSAAPQTCPVCESFVGLEAISSFCDMKAIVSGHIKVDRKNERVSKGRLAVDSVLVGKNMGNDKRPFKVSMRSDCSCPQLEKDNNKVIIMTPDSKALPRGFVKANEEVFIVKDSPSVRSDIEDLKARCL